MTAVGTVAVRKLLEEENTIFFVVVVKADLEVTWQNPFFVCLVCGWGFLFGFVFFLQTSLQQFCDT